MWTFCRKAARTAVRDRLLCPPGNTSISTVKNLWSGFCKMHHTLQAYTQVIRLFDLSGPCPKSEIMFHFLLLFVSNWWDGKTRGNIVWRSYLLAIPIPRDTGLVQAATMTMAPIMRTMRINNERHECTVATLTPMSLLITQIHSLLFIRTFIVLLKRTLQTSIFHGACHLFFENCLTCMTTSLSHKVIFPVSLFCRHYFIVREDK